MRDALSVAAAADAPFQASGASVAWFVLLGYGARWLAPLFARPRAWKWLDRLIGVTMFVLAALLLRHALGGASPDGAG